MERVNIELGEQSYTIYICENLLDNIRDYMGAADQWIIITDSNVDKLYGLKIRNAMKEEKLCKYVISPGESSKTINITEGVLAYMLQNQLTRKSKVIALGGGVVGDLAGFCASIYMRGISFIQVPTTLLSQVDSSVGGKTGVNLPHGKNMIGTFYQPEAVVIDTAVLDTLPKRELMSGIGEIIKHSIIYDYEFFKYINAHFNQIYNLEKEALKYVIKRNCEIKAGVVSKDEKETGLRKILNFGHTFGHALETVSGYERITHGEAVIVGMYYEACMAKKLGFIDEEYFSEIERLIGKTHISLDLTGYNKNTLIDTMTRDKKNVSGKISFILPAGKGKVKEVLLSQDEISW